MQNFNFQLVSETPGNVILMDIDIKIENNEVSGKMVTTLNDGTVGMTSSYFPNNDGTYTVTNIGPDVEDIHNEANREEAIFSVYDTLRTTDVDSNYYLEARGEENEAFLASAIEAVYNTVDSDTQIKFERSIEKARLDQELMALLSNF